MQIPTNEKGVYPMSVNHDRAFALLKDMAYERMSGTPEETRCAQMLCDVAAKAGVQSYIEEFPVYDGVVTCAELEVTAPYQKKYTVTGYLRSESTGEEGIEADFLYVENALPVNLMNARDKIVLLNGRPTHDVYKALKEAGVRGVITWNGEYDEDPDKSDLNVNMLRPLLTDKFGATVAVNMRVLDAMELVTMGASRVRVKVLSESTTSTSRNVIAVIPGTEKPEEEIIIGAHYDSVRFSTGVYDNGAGSVSIMELLHHFAENPPKRTVRFIWFGSEEVGLVGSKYYSDNHDLSNVRLMLNLDVGGPILGVNVCFVTGDKASVGYVDGLLQEGGYAFKTEQHIQSSDSTPFTDHDVPCVNFFRGAAPGAGRMHTRADTLVFLSAEGLGKIIDPAVMFADRVVNSRMFPIARVVPPEMKEAVDKYYFRKK